MQTEAHDGSENLSGEWYEKQYDPRLPQYPLSEIFAEWERRSEPVLRSKRTVRDFPYGLATRERLDFYRALDPRGTVIFFHGGYWKSGFKEQYGWIAEGFLANGISVAIPNYLLCPDATLIESIACAKRAFIALWNHVLIEPERRGIVVTGHSAGGYLAAYHLVVDWVPEGLPKSPLAGVATVSGLFELKPLLKTSMNTWLRLDQTTATQLSLTEAEPTFSVPLLLMVGSLESQEFQRQSVIIGEAWPTVPHVHLHADGHHFSVLDELGFASGSLNKKIVALLEASED